MRHSYQNQLLWGLQRYRVILFILIISTLFLQNTLANDYAKWNLPEGARLRLGKGRVWKINFFQDSNRLSVLSSIGIWIYDTRTGEELSFIPEHASNIVAVCPQNRVYISIEPDNSVQIHDLNDVTVKVTIDTDTDDIRNLTICQEGRFLAGSIGNDIHIWDLDTGELNATLVGHTNSIMSINFSPNGTMLASGSWDETVRIWDIAIGEHIKTLTPPQNKTDLNLLGVDNVLFSPDGKTFVSTSSNERMMHFWDTTTWQRLSSTVTIAVEDIAFSPDSNTLAICSSGGGLHLYDVATAERKAELTRHISWITSIAFSPDGTTLASGGLSELHLWDVTTGAQKLSINGHSSSVHGLALAPDSQTIAAGNRYEVRLWDTINGTLQTVLYENETLEGDGRLAFSPDGKTLACEHGRSIRLWNVADGTHQGKLKGYLGKYGYGIASIAYSPNGAYLACVNDNSTVMLWHKGRAFIGRLSGHKGLIWSIAFSRDSQSIATGGYDNTIRLWDIESGNHLATYEGHTEAVRCIAISPDDRILASGSEDNSVILWDIFSAEPIAHLLGHPSWVTSVAFSPDGKTLVSASMHDSVIRLWNIPSGLPTKILDGHSYGINSLAFSSDGYTLASASSDGTILLWNMETETPFPKEDVNRDGIVDITDLIMVATQFGKPDAERKADINGDGVVDIADILLVAGALANANAAPSLLPISIDSFDATSVQEWLTQAQKVKMKTSDIQRGITVLEHLLSMLIPKESVLLHNYPNPFNPETWIPYQLAEPIDVTIRIYSSDGQLVRTLDIGHQSAGIYHNPSQAAHWDGKNQFGEPAASGIYFYSLTAGQFTATRQMVIRK